MELPHIGDLPLGTYCFKNASICAVATVSSKVEAFTLSIKPLRLCVPWFHASMPANTTSDWWITSTGDSPSTFNSASVTTTASSKMRSLSGNKPLISISSQIKLSILKLFPLFCIILAASIMISIKIRVLSVFTEP